jgi:NitT/TauT family transport system substrate-binding protein
LLDEFGRVLDVGGVQGLVKGDETGARCLLVVTRETGASSGWNTPNATRSSRRRSTVAGSPVQQIAEKDVTIIPIGADMAPLLTGQVDVVTGWLTNTTALKVLGDQRVEMRLWDSGVRLYALPYYATVDTLTKKPELLAKFLQATSKGWAFARGEPEKAVDFLVKEFPNLDRADELDAAKVMLQYAFSAATKTEGWGAMDPAVWQDQISLYAELGQFSKRVPEVNEVMTLDILKMTADTRAKLG